jgi:hypothetical protein
MKHQLPLKPRQITSSASNQAIWMANIKFWTQEGSNQNTRFLNAKDHTPPESKANQTKRQIQPKTPTPPEVENPRFYQMSLDKPQGKHRPTESHIYTRDEHHDGRNMGRNQSIVTQSGKQIKPHKKQG